MKKLFTSLAIISMLFSCSNSDVEAEKLKLEQEKLKLEREKLESAKGKPEGENQEKDPAEVPAKDNTSKFNAKVTGSSVNMRSNHSTTASPVTLLNYGQEVTILDRYRPQGNYDEAILKSQTNFYDESSGQFVFSLIKGKAVQVISNDGDRCRITFVNEKNKTGFASISPSQLEFISGEAWYYISTASGQKGWVLGKYIQEK